MSPIRLILASLVYHRRTNLAVALAVAAAAAVLTGALLVGDSMRGSLRHLTLDRLGRVDEVLVTDRFFRAGLADELAHEPEFQQSFADAVPVVLLRASLENPDGAHAGQRAGRVNLIGCDERFWRLGSGGPEPLPSGREIALNRPLARQLGVAVGDAVMVRVARPGTIPADSPLGRKDETVDSLRLRVSAIIEAEGLGRFGLRPSQQLPRNAYLPLATLQRRLDRPERANAILVAGREAGAPDTASHERLQSLLRPRLEDYGIRLEKTPRGYLNITTDRMLLGPATEEALDRALTGREVQPALTYLANTIACRDRTIPYSTITAIDFTDRPLLGPFLDTEGKPISPLDENQIVLNAWAAEDLGCKPGDTIRVSYFEPESTHGALEERTAEFTLAAVTPLAGAAADRDLTPRVPGVTDQTTMADWDPPFPFDARRIRPKDEAYWIQHAATPKAFVSLAAGRKLWGSRFGRTTSLRVQGSGAGGQGPGDKGRGATGLVDLTLDPAELGFVLQPVKQQALAASVGTTSFSQLFLGFSLFIIAAAVMLVALLFRLGVDTRAVEIGVLLALGVDRRRIGRMLAVEGLIVAMLGSLVGTLLGVGYAALMLHGLRTWWLAAVVTPFLRLYVTPVSLAVGFATGLAVAVLVILFSVRRVGRLSTRRLMAGETDEASGRFVPRGRRGRSFRWLAAVLAATVVLVLLSARIGDELRAGVFFGAGALVLVLLLVWTRLVLGRNSSAQAVTAGRGNLARLALRNAARHPGRSTLSIGLVGATCFLIVAISAFRLDPTGRRPELSSGNGGFALLAESDQPIYHDLNTPEGRAELGFSQADSRLLAECRAVAFRVKPGDDATCLNLYRPRQPRLLGVPEAMIRRGGFAWTAAADGDNPWEVLSDTAREERPGGGVPMVLEKNTAVYSLHLAGDLGATYTIADEQGRSVPLVVAGLLGGSVFQGDLLVSEAELLRRFPDVSGYRFFLIETPEGKAGDVRAALERTLGDYGFAAETTGERLAGLLAVQNTYLSTFQSLGGLGLLLGTFGLAAVQMRNVIERRRELALLRATGFRRRTLAALVMAENGLLLVGGLACGVAAALVAVLPHLLAGAAAIPWLWLAGTLALILAVGLVASLAAVRAAVTAPLLATLREE